jgi:glycolate oxidase FAD binding subunit
MPQAAEELLAALDALAPGAVRPAEARDAVDGVRPGVVVAPTDEASLAAVLAYADGAGLAVVPRGGGTQLGLGFPPRRADIVLSLEHLASVVEHAPADQTVTVEAGLPLAALQARLAESGQWLALDPDLPPTATLGGIIATNASGPRRLHYGGVRDLLIGIRVALADGTRAKGGGKVVKNVAGYDLPKLYTGSLGTLGVITAATFRLHPLPAASRVVLLAAPTLPPLGELVARILASSLVPAALDLHPPSAPGATYTLAARFESSVAAAVEEQAAALIALAGSGVTPLPNPLSVAPGKGGPVRTAVVLGGSDGRGRQGAGGTQPSGSLSLAEGERSSLALKASVLLTGVVPWLTQLNSVAAEWRLMTQWVAHAGHGLIYASLSGPDEALMSAIERLRGETITQRGSLVVTAAPSTLADRLDLWGPSPALPLMRQLKARFDPHATLNPGRFLGRI